MRIAKIRMMATAMVMRMSKMAMPIGGCMEQINFACNSAPMILFEGRTMR